MSESASSLTSLLPIVTGSVGLDVVEGAFATLADPNAQHAKILIDPSLVGTAVR